MYARAVCAPGQVVTYQLPDGSGAVPRQLTQLSGGERRRVALALALGFAALVRDRGRLRCNLLVLDEVSRLLWAHVMRTVARARTLAPLCPESGQELLLSRA